MRQQVHNELPKYVPRESIQGKQERTMSTIKMKGNKKAENKKAMR